MSLNNTEFFLKLEETISEFSLRYRKLLHDAEILVSRWATCQELCIESTEIDDHSRALNELCLIIDHTESLISFCTTIGYTGLDVNHLHLLVAEAQILLVEGKGNGRDAYRPASDSISCAFFGFEDVECEDLLYVKLTRAKLRRRLSNFPGALRDLNDVRAGALQYENDFLQADATIELAWLYVCQKEFELAASYYEEAAKCNVKDCDFELKALKEAVYGN